MTGDIVIVKVKRQGKRGGQMQYSGEVIEVLERAQNRFVGTLLKHPEAWIVQPDGSSFFEPISVDDVGAKGAKEKDKVVVEILSYPTEKYLARGVIIEVLGKAGRYDTEIKSIIHQYHLPGEFEEDCIKQARQASAKFNPEKIDKLDTEAKDRGNSVYLPGKTIPMLPEILSNGICSLQPEQKRFVKSVYLTYDQKGNVVSRNFTNSIICSTQRLTYQQADRILKGHTKDAKPEVIDLLKNMDALSRLIEQRRTKNGMIHLDLPEIQLKMDKSGRVVGANPADTSYPHTIIEMFMVEANEAVASLLDRLNLAFIRRIHPEPDVMSMKNLAKLLKAFGFSLPRNPNRRAIQDILAAVKGADCSFAVNLAVLRSFEKAQYAPLHIGHYALASTHYCHFTSPIRRYADLAVHRVLEYYLQKRPDLARDVSAGLDLTEIGKHITFTEQRAEDAEKELTAVLILQMLSKQIGEELDCVVTRLGQAIKVRITSVNVPARQLNVTPIEPLATAPTKRSKSKPQKKYRRRKRKS